MKKQERLASTIVVNERTDVLRHMNWRTLTVEMQRTCSADLFGWKMKHFWSHLGKRNARETIPRAKIYENSHLTKMFLPSCSDSRVQVRCWHCNFHAIQRLWGPLLDTPLVSPYLFTTRSKENSVWDAWSGFHRKWDLFDLIIGVSRETSVPNATAAAIVFPPRTKYSKTKFVLADHFCLHGKHLHIYQQVISSYDSLQLLIYGNSQEHNSETFLCISNPFSLTCLLRGANKFSELSSRANYLPSAFLILWKGFFFTLLRGHAKWHEPRKRCHQCVQDL